MRDVDSSFKATYVVDPAIKHQIVRSSMVFPCTASLSVDTPITRAEYSCDANECNFWCRFQSNKRQPRYSSLGRGKVLVDIATDIQKHCTEQRLNSYGFIPKIDFNLKYIRIYSE